MQMMQFAFFASPTLKNNSKFNPDRLKSCDFSVTTPYPLTTHFVRKDNSAGAFYEGWLSQTRKVSHHQLPNLVPQFPYQNKAFTFLGSASFSTKTGSTKKD